jgi:hypothetical protein
MRPLTLLLLAAACEREWVREYQGAVPGTDEPLTTIVLVRDALTGRPIPGAIVRQRPENTMGRDGRWAPLAAEGRTDELGIVTFRMAEVPPISHWTIHAEGYAPTEEYGQVLDEEVELRPGMEFVGRILALDGSPLADAVIEWKVGCAHSPSLASTTTDKTGFYRFEGIEDADFVFEDPRGAAEYLGGPRGPGFGVPVEQVLPGRTIRGRVVTREGSPPPWAVIATNARGPRAAADAEGRFALHGFDRGTLDVWWDGPMAQSTDDVAPGLKVLLVAGRPTVEARRVEVHVRVSPPDPLKIHFDRLADGRRLSFDWDPDDPSVRVPLGTYLVSAGYPWSSPVAAPVRVDLRARREIELVARAQPTLDLPDLPEPATARIVLEDESWMVEAPEPAYLPATVRAWLRVDLGRTPYTFAIGPEREGVRRADVRLPGRKFIRVPGLEEGLSAGLIGEAAEVTDGPEPHDVQIGSAGLATYAVGEQWLQLAHPEKGYAVVKLDLPFAAATVEPDCTLTPWPAPVELSVLLDDGTPVAGADIHVLDDAEPPGCLATPEEPSETDEHGILRRRWLRDGLHMRITRDDGDCVWSWARLSGEPPYEVRLGSAVVEVDVAGLESAACVIDGFAWSAEGGTIVLRGLEAGPHTLLVGAEGREGVAYRRVLRPGERRRLKPTHPPRPPPSPAKALCFGSSASCNASVKMLNARTRPNITAVAAPICQKNPFTTSCFAWLIMIPHEGSFLTPRPRKVSSTSDLIAEMKSRENCTSMRCDAFGSTCFRRIFQRRWPSAVAACT